MYRERRDAMVAALDEHLPEASWNVPDGGFYTWVTLPDGLDAKDMLPRAVTARVAYVPGTAFYFDGSGADHMRLSFCYPTPERIREGVRRLAGVVAGERELVELFGTTVVGPRRPAARSGRRLTCGPWDLVGPAGSAQSARSLVHDLSESSCPSSSCDRSSAVDVIGAVAVSTAHVTSRRRPRRRALPRA